MYETMVKILHSFPKYPHLRMAVAALALVGEDKLLNAGEVEEFERWVLAHHRMQGEFGTCRHFLMALCPLRFDHTKKSRYWSNIVDRFHDAALALDEALRNENRLTIALDFAPQSRMGLQKPGKKARAALEVVEKIVKAYAEEKGYRVIGYDERNAEKHPCVSFIPSFSASKVYTVKATTDGSMVLAKALCSDLDKTGRSLALTENEGLPVHELPGINEIAICFPVHATDYNEAEMAEEIAGVARIMFEGV